MQMDLASILADVQIAISLGKLAIQIGQDAAPFIETAYDILFNNKQLTSDERNDLLSKEAGLRAQLQKPLDDNDN